MTLNVDLVRRAKAFTGNLSETVEGLLAAYVAAEEAKRANIRVQIQHWVDASNAAVERFGAPGDEYTPF